MGATDLDAESKVFKKTDFENRFVLLIGFILVSHANSLFSTLCYRLFPRTSISFCKIITTIFIIGFSMNAFQVNKKRIK